LSILGVPLLATEQYPAGLGPTIHSIREILKHSETIEKISFSCCGEPRFLSALDDLGRKNVIICGIEAHVCVLQTVTDLAAKAYLPVVVADCISSRNSRDRELAIERMRTEGAVITTAESILFELAGVAGTGEFKSISRLVK
jgi:nicotinamidase-related amidase